MAIQILEKAKEQFVSIKNKAILLHEYLKQYREEDLETIVENRNIYQIALDWVIETLQFGILSSYVYFSFIGFEGVIQFIKMTLCFGFLLWVIKHTIGEVKKQIS